MFTLTIDQENVLFAATKDLGHFTKSWHNVTPHENGYLHGFEEKDL